MGTESSTLFLWPLEPHQRNVVVAAVRPVLFMHHNLLDSNFFLILFWYQCVIVSNSHSIVPSVVAIPD